MHTIVQNGPPQSLQFNSASPNLKRILLPQSSMGEGASESINGKVINNNCFDEIKTV